MSTKKAKIEIVGRVSSASVLKGTGRNWDEWMPILEKAGARHWEHKEIVAFLKRKYKLTPWWQQGVTLGYEIHIGRRLEGQNAKGEYGVTVTKAFSLSQKQIWQKLVAVEGAAVWLQPMSDFSLKLKNEYEVEGGIFGEVRTMKAPLRARLTWQDTEWPKPTIVQIYVVPQPKQKKCILVFNHEGLKTPTQREQMRAHWRAAIERFYNYCQGNR